ncbi:uncharacterized protein PHACADRAFT_262643 [Phanerochaete carnosa HHB-10118-sp]|uniref:Uncharacterized protein n=1 Tax=Phanerochaete carnosa (strain HHB-10118-sp) TaxID=650164 RepID=K5WP72_PHACS|nr:uncharacterized protein PHACADRAFT_262643 [Phanerochaete carnosa HHB-10118-sp]EKM52137.1 hypothetical protein PHACADRAFT_262643 [Phanerochaete carnosa HHB-10118-sp]
MVNALVYLVFSRRGSGSSRAVMIWRGNIRKMVLSQGIWREKEVKHLQVHLDVLLAARQMTLSLAGSAQRTSPCPVFPDNVLRLPTERRHISHHQYRSYDLDRRGEIARQCSHESNPHVPHQ